MPRTLRLREQLLKRDFEMTQTLKPTAFDRLEPTLELKLSRHLDSSVPSHLIESIRYSLLAPGKRIRPRLVMACADMIGLDADAALSAACALEMVHCYTLIHDDLPCMDDDDFRRGRPSNHKQFGEATALLAGDALMALSMDTLLDASAQVEPGHLVDAIRTLSWAMGPRAVIGGQAAEELLNKDSTLEALEQMHAQKTGALFSAALLLPKNLAGIRSDRPEGKAIDRFADELGLAFQVADDLEDAVQDGVAPNNILAYLSEQEARKRTHQRLTGAMKELETHWGARSATLLRIANEVASKLTPP